MPDRGNGGELVTAATLLASGTALLREAAADGMATPRLDAEVLVRHALGWSREMLLLHMHRADAVTRDAADQYHQLIERRQRGEPIAYIVGRREFYGCSIVVDRRVLVPRPETELLVELAIAAAPPGCLVADVGTGSGAIAVALAHARPDLRVIATDRSAPALALAAENVRGHGVADRVGLVQCALLAAVREPLRVVVANLPYIATTDVAGLPRDVRDFEPRDALDGGPDGFALSRGLLAEIASAHHGVQLVLLEIGVEQGPLAENACRGHWPNASVRLFADLTGIPRVVEIWPTASRSSGGIA